MNLLVSIIPSAIALCAVIVSGISIIITSRNSNKILQTNILSIKFNKEIDYQKNNIFEFVNNMSEFMLLTYDVLVSFQSAKNHNEYFPRDENEKQLQNKTELLFHKILLKLDQNSEIDYKLLTQINSFRYCEVGSWIDERDILIKISREYINHKWNVINNILSN